MSGMLGNHTVMLHFLWRSWAKMQMTLQGCFSSHCAFDVLARVRELTAMNLQKEEGKGLERKRPGKEDPLPDPVLQGGKRKASKTGKQAVNAGRLGNSLASSKSVHCYCSTGMDILVHEWRLRFEVTMCLKHFWTPEKTGRLSGTNPECHPPKREETTHLEVM